MSVLSETNISKICRTCASTSTNLKPLYQNVTNSTHTSFAQLVMALTPLKCYENDGLPTQICTNCLTTLFHFEKFQQECLGTDALLRQQFHQPIKIEDTNYMLIKTENIESDANPIIVEQFTSKQSPKTSLLASDFQIESNQPLNITNNDFSGLETTNSFVSNKTWWKPEETQPDIESNMSPSVTYSTASNYTYDTHAVYTLQPNIVQNMRPHYNYKAHTCAICHRAFPFKTQLTGHLLTHATKSRKRKTANRPIPIQSSLNTYKRSITKKNTHACAVCRKVCKHKSALELHMREHGEKPYACVYCNNTFRLQRLLNKHMRNHIASQQFCAICGETFSGKMCMKQHKIVKQELFMKFEPKSSYY